MTSIGYVNDALGGRAALFEAVGDFRLTKLRAVEIFDEVRAASRLWREVAVGNGATPRECDQFAEAFDRFA